MKKFLRKIRQTFCNHEYTLEVFTKRNVSILKNSAKAKL